MSDFLMHHGIHGQKWGIRRYQNPDGTLTPEGKARYGSGTSLGNTGERHATVRTWMKDYKKPEAKENKGINMTFKPGKDGKASQAEKAARAGSDAFVSGKRIRDNVNKIKNREAIAEEQNKIKSMSDVELRQHINRLNMEKQYKQLAEEDIMAGKASTEEILGIIGDVLAIGVSAATIGTMIYTAKGGK